MNKKLEILLIILFSLIIGFLAIIILPNIANGNLKNYLASVFFIESSTPEDLKLSYQNALLGNDKLRILIVPGHDDKYWGTQFNGIKESDMNLEIANRLGALFSDKKEFEVYISRDEFGYNPVIEDFFTNNSNQIMSFVKSKKKIMTDLMASSQASKVTGVIHNNAQSEVVKKLYGINKWANDSNIDLVIHIHFNDYPRKNVNKAGYYTGFSIYIPEKQFSNSRASKEIAKSVFDELSKYYKKSDLPKEDTGVVEDQELIAVGSFNTLDPASILIEYGYIYEDKFSTANFSSTAQLMTKATYDGIINFLNKR